MKHSLASLLALLALLFLHRCNNEPLTNPIEPVFDLSFNHVGYFLGTDFWINQLAVPRFFKNKSNADGSANESASYTELTSVDVTGAVGVFDHRIFGKF